MIWQSIAEEQARIIEELTSLCAGLISELSQFKNIEEEEAKLKAIEGVQTDGIRDND